MKLAHGPKPASLLSPLASWMTVLMQARNWTHSPASTRLAPAPRNRPCGVHPPLRTHARTCWPGARCALSRPSPRGSAARRARRGGGTRAAAAWRQVCYPARSAKLHYACPLPSPNASIRDRTCRAAARACRVRAGRRGAVVRRQLRACPVCGSVCRVLFARCWHCSRESAGQQRMPVHVDSARTYCSCRHHARTGARAWLQEHSSYLFWLTPLLARPRPPACPPAIQVPLMMPRQHCSSLVWRCC